MQRTAPPCRQRESRGGAAVKVAKRLIIKSKASKEDLELALLEWRSVPHKEGLSPNQRFLNRKTRSLLPAQEEEYQPRIHKEARSIIQKRRETQRKQHDRGAVSLKRLKPGDRVRLEPQGFSHEWPAATVTGQLNTRTYTVRTDNGSELIRNRKFLKQVPAPEARSPTQEGTVTPESDQSTTNETKPSDVIPAQDEGGPGREGGELTTRSGRIVRRPARYEQ